MNYIDNDDLKKLVASDKDIIIIDIRSTNEHTSEKIPNSVNHSIEALKAAPKTEWENKTLIFHCQSGMRTKQAEDVLSTIPCKNAFCLQGGITQWKASGLSTIKNKKGPIEIMRQVQIIIGTVILLGILLAYTVSPYFILISVFISLGTIFAGITGTCAMGNLLMKLPYNQPSK